MNKLKVAIQELKDHLGRDSRGVLLLDAVTTVANSQRTRCTTLAASVEEAKVKEAELRSRIESLESQTATVKEELQQESAKRRSSEVREKHMAQQLVALQTLEEYSEELRTADDDTIRRKVERLVKRVSKRWKRLPSRALVKGSSLIADFFVEDYVKTFSYDEFAGLGMVAALCAYFDYPITVVAENILPHDDPPSEWDEKYMSQFVFLLGNNMHFTATESRILTQSEPDHFRRAKRGLGKSFRN